jgi:hypothetical protein
MEKSLSEWWEKRLWFNFVFCIGDMTECIGVKVHVPA